MAGEKRKENVLWTKNFTLITLGTVISILGNSAGGICVRTAGT